MLREKALTFTCMLLSLEVVAISAYPVINIPYLSAEARYKKNDLGFPVVHANVGSVADGDVLELEHLKRNHGETETEEQRPLDTLPELQSELEAVLPTTDATSPSTPITRPAATTTAKTEIGKNTLHHSPVMPSSEHKMIGQQTGTVPENTAPETSQAIPSMAKPFYGAARLAFGQNPELLPTSSTTSTTTTTTATTSSSMAPTENVTNMPVKSVDAKQLEIKDDPDEAIIPEEVATEATLKDDETNLAMTGNSQNQPKETIGDVFVDELERAKKAVSSSMNEMLPKTAKGLLHHRDGQYSSFDMAQYIFWTGDETGVAHAVEECIQKNLMSRENALKFLRDIRMGIEYLQRSYENRILPETIRQNSVKKSYVPPPTTTTTTINPLRYIEHGENSAQLIKTLDSIALWNKLQELNTDGRQDVTEYDEAAGRAKIAEFLYTHYTIEDILYKLAKVMFTQSLAHGSDEAQRELQKLTDFLEREGNLGVIPIDLQKKVLHVLLTALSDTLTEHPELLPAARQNLINPYERLPLRAYGVMN